MRWDSSDRALLSLVCLFAVVYVSLLGMTSQLLHRVDGGRVLPGNHIAADAVMFGLAVLTVTTLGVGLTLRHVSAARRMTAAVADRAIASSPELRRLAGELALADVIVLIDDEAPAAFTLGVLRPRVVISRGLLRLATERELTAILAHEAYHVRRRDPARRLVATVLCLALLRVPVAVQLRDRALAAAELEADRQALRRSGPRPVAEALHRLLLTAKPPEPHLVAPMAGSELLAARVAQLETGSTPVMRIATSPWLRTLVGLTIVIGAVDVVLHAHGYGGQMSFSGPGHGIAHALPLWGLWVVDWLLHRPR